MFSPAGTAARSSVNPHFNYSACQLACSRGDPPPLTSESLLRGSQQRKAECLINTLLALKQLISAAVPMNSFQNAVAYFQVLPGEDLEHVPEFLPPYGNVRPKKSSQ